MRCACARHARSESPAPCARNKDNTEWLCFSLASCIRQSSRWSWISIFGNLHTVIPLWFHPIFNCIYERKPLNFSNSVGTRGARFEQLTQWTTVKPPVSDVRLKWSLTGGDRLREVSLIAIWLTEEPIGILVRWSLKRGCHLREVSLMAIWLTEEPIGILVSWLLTGGGRSGRFRCNHLRQ